MASDPIPSNQEDRTERLFIALTLPPAVRDILAGIQQRISGLNWTKSEQLHMTLRFLGDVPESHIGPMIHRLSAVTVEPFVLPVEGIGTFPPNRPPRVVWVGAGAGHPRLFQLRQRIDDAVLGAGVELDVRNFHPHVTMARCSESVSPAVTHWLHAHRDFSASPFRVEAFDLFASELRSTGAVHTLRRRFPLGATASGAPQR